MASDALSEYEKFMAQEFGSALHDASLALAFLRNNQIPKQEFVQLAAPLFAALATFAEATKRSQFQECDRLWTDDDAQTEKGRMSARECFAMTLTALQEELEIAAGLFEANPCPAVVPQ